MGLPPELQAKILKKIELEIDRQIQQLSDQDGARRRNLVHLFFAWLGQNAVGIGTLIAVLTLMYNVFSSEIARNNQQKLASEQLANTEQQRREDRFFALVERTFSLIEDMSNKKYYVILSNLRELRAYVMQNSKHGGSLALLSMPILTSEEAMGSTLYTMATDSFVAGLEQISATDFKIYFKEWSVYWKGVYEKRGELNLETSDLTRIVCALGYTQVRVYGKGVTSGCWPREQVFTKD